MKIRCFLLLVLGFPLCGEMKEKIFPLTPTLIHHKKAFVFQDGTLVTKREPFANEEFAEFHLDFEEENEGYFHSPLKLLNKGFLGKGAEFLTRDNRRVYRGPLSPFFERHPDIGDFTVELNCKFHSLMGEQILFDRSGYIHDANNDDIIAQGLVFKLHHRRLVVEMLNFFHFKDEKKSMELISKSRLQAAKWYRIRLVFEGDTGRLSLYLGDALERQAYVTENARWDGKIYYPAFLKENKHPLVLGKDQIGITDELKIFPFPHPPDKKQSLEPIESVFTTKVFALEDFSKLKRVLLSGRYDLDTMEGFLRIKDHYFREDASFRWLPIPLDASLPESYVGKYCQLKFINRNYLPERPHQFKAITMFYEIDPIPTSPVLLRVIARPRGFVVEWEKSTESDIEGYLLYYREMHKGREFQIQPLPVKKGTSSGVDGDERLSHKIEGLKNAVRYEVFMTSYDGLGKTHASKPSRTLTVTPRLFP